MSERRPRIAVVTFPGSNDDGDARLALELLGAEAVAVWHAETTLPEGTGGVVLPGGFSYGDYLRCGAIARFAPVMDAVRRFAEDGGPVLGICNGFQILCEAGLLPGVLRPNRQLEFLCADVRLTVESSATPFTAAVEPGDELVIPVKHGEGCWVADDELFAQVADAAGRAPVCGRRQRRARSRRGRCERGGERPRPDAASRARGRPASRPDGRRATPRRAARCGAGACRARRSTLTAGPHATRRGGVGPPIPGRSGGVIETVPPAEHETTERRRSLERHPKLREVALAKGHRASPARPVRRVRKADEPLASVRLEELDTRREAPVARPLRHGHRLDALRLAPGCRHRRHRGQRSAACVTRLRRDRAGSATICACSSCGRRSGARSHIASASA